MGESLIGVEGERRSAAGRRRRQDELFGRPLVRGFLGWAVLVVAVRAWRARRLAARRVPPPTQLSPADQWADTTPPSPSPPPPRRSHDRRPEPASGPRPQTATEEAELADLAGMWERFRDTFGQQVAVLEDAAAAILSQQLTAEHRERALREAHKLAGSLGTFGMPRGSEIAREVESWLQADLEAEQADTLRVADAIVALRACVEAGPALDDAATRVLSDPDQPFLLLVDDDPMVADGLRRGASLRGSELVVVDNADEATQLITSRRPEAVILDLAASGSERAFDLMRQVQDSRPPVPVVVLTRRDVFTDRVEAARLGGRGFLEKPVAPAAVLSAVDDITHRVRAGEASVLAVDDDPAILAALSQLLDTEGARVVTLNEPLRFWETLTATSPDLVVLDVDMPGVSGIELCQVIRGDPRWSQVPVVFLTARTDTQSIQAVFAAGADDYVSKPLVGAELTARIANRIERSRLLRRMAEIDPLTGVANQRTSAEAIERLLAVAEPLGQPVALAMVDVDRMKSVNDRFGYGAGDEVIARVGHILLRSFVGDDVVGRWGGQEFLVGMPGMTPTDGVERLADVLEELRLERFSDGEGGWFGATFSAGVAQFPDDGMDLRSLYRAADGALRLAKEAGGDRVVPVGWTTEDWTTDVVLVDDDEALAGVLLHSLGTRAYRTEHFDDGQDAVAALQGPNPAVVPRVVLLDWGLPSLDGLSVLRRLSESGVLARTRVIMLTARDSESEVLQALDLGAFDHVAKPFSVPVLMKRVHRAVEG